MKNRFGPGLYVLDAAGNPIPEDDLETWARWYERAREARRVALDVTEHFRISTIFLGLDHGHDGGSPVLWETMAFIDGQSVAQWRYRSKALARRGHQVFCRWARIQEMKAKREVAAVLNSSAT
jgi:hypothetical protein